MKVLTGAILAMLLLAGAGLLFVWTGAYQIAAAEPHSRLVRWLLSTVRDRSIVAHAREPLDVPDLNDPQRIHAGFHLYHTMCRICHGAPGQEPNEIRKGLNPQPPALDAERVRRRTDAELFWVAKNGIRMTGMPAFGKSHDDAQLWDVVAFVRHLPELGPQGYQRMVAEDRLPENPGGHADGH